MLAGLQKEEMSLSDTLILTVDYHIMNRTARILTNAVDRTGHVPTHRLSIISVNSQIFIASAVVWLTARCRSFCSGLTHMAVLEHRISSYTVTLVPGGCNCASD